MINQSLKIKVDYNRKRIITSFLFIFSIIISSYSQDGYKYRDVPAKYISKINFSFTYPQSTQVKDLTSLLPKNYVKDGSVDYTSYLQAGINKYRNVILPNFPILINDGGLNVPSNTTIYFNKNSKLIMKGSSKGTDSKADVYQAILLDRVSNVNIYNANIEGDRYKHLGKEGEWGHGINILSSSKVKILNARIRNCWGDGLYIGRNNKVRDSKGNYVPSSEIIVSQSVIDNNRRNGISLTCGKNIEINKVVLSNQNGTLPMSGIDIEPNIYLDAIDNIKLEDIITYNNRQDGILIVLTRLTSKERSNTCNISINRHVDENSYGAIRLGSGFPRGNKSLKGKIIITESTWINNAGLRYRSGYDQLPEVLFSKIKQQNLKVVKNNEKYRASGNRRSFEELVSKEKRIKIVL